MSGMAYSHILHLPAEVRNDIYSLFFQPLVQHAERKAKLICEGAAAALDPSIHAAGFWPSRRLFPAMSEQDTVDVKEYLPLLLVCHQIHEEASPICYNNVTFYAQKPLDFANNFLLNLGLYKLSQIRHLEIRLKGAPINVDTWAYLASKPSYSNHHHVGKLFENYPELECLTTLVIKVEKLADTSLARCSNLLSGSLYFQDWSIESAWSQNKDTTAMKSWLTRLKLGTGSQSFQRAFNVVDEYDIEEKDRIALRTVDGRYACKINMRRTFQFTMWKISEV